MSTWSSDQPWVAPPPSGSRVSATLIARVYAMVMEDMSLVVLVAVGSVASVVVFAGIFVPAWYFGGLSPVPHGLDLTWCVYAVAAWATAFVSVMFSGAVVAAGVARLDGRPITVRQALAVAWGRKKQLAAWALLTTVVGLMLNLLNRVGLGGAILRWVAGLAWAAATMLVLPVIIVEGRMPRDAVVESVGIVKSQLMLTVRSKVRLYAPLMVAAFFGMFLVVAGVVTYLQYRHETPEWA